MYNVSTWYRVHPTAFNTGAGNRSEWQNPNLTPTEVGKRTTRHQISTYGAAVSTLDTSDIAEEKAETQWEIGDLISRVPAQPLDLWRQTRGMCMDVTGLWQNTERPFMLISSREKGAGSTPYSVYYNYLFTYFILSIVRCIVWKRGFRIRLQI